MMRSILRISLTILALVLLFAGSFNLNRTIAQEIPDEILETGKGFCEWVGCAGGPILCAVLIAANGARIECGMADSKQGGLTSSAP